MKRIAAAGTGRAVEGRKFSPAGIADWHGRKARQRRAAEGARGGQEGASYSIPGTSEHPGNGAPPRYRRWREIDHACTGVSVEDTPHAGRVAPSPPVYAEQMQRFQRDNALSASIGDGKRV